MYSKIRKNVVLWAEAEKTGRKKQDMAEKNKDKTNVMRPVRAEEDSIQRIYLRM